MIFSLFIFDNVMIKFWKNVFSFSGGGIIMRYRYRLIFSSPRWGVVETRCQFPFFLGLRRRGRGLRITTRPSTGRRREVGMISVSTRGNYVLFYLFIGNAFQKFVCIESTVVI